MTPQVIVGIAVQVFVRFRVVLLVRMATHLVCSIVVILSPVVVRTAVCQLLNQTSPIPACEGTQRERAACVERTKVKAEKSPKRWKRGTRPRAGEREHSERQNETEIESWWASAQIGQYADLPAPVPIMRE
jgi:hypothetical protein